MSRETIVVDHYGQTWCFRGKNLSVQCDTFIFPLTGLVAAMCIGITETANTTRERNQCNFVTDPNCLDLVLSKAPISIVIDAILEVSPSQWHSSYGQDGIARAIAALEAIALMDIIPMEAT